MKDESTIIIEEESNQIVAKIKMTQNKVFPLKMSIENLAIKTEENNTSLLWQWRYGHLNFGILNLLKKEKYGDQAPTHTQGRKILWRLYLWKNA